MLAQDCSIILDDCGRIQINFISISANYAIFRPLFVKQPRLFARQPRLFVGQSELFDTFATFSDKQLTLFNESVFNCNKQRPRSVKQQALCVKQPLRSIKQPALFVKQRRYSIEQASLFVPTCACCTTHGKVCTPPSWRNHVP